VLTVADGGRGDGDGDDDDIEDDDKVTETSRVGKEFIEATHRVS